VWLLSTYYPQTFNNVPSARIHSMWNINVLYKQVMLLRDDMRYSSTAWQTVQLKLAANSPAQDQYQHAGTVPRWVIQSVTDSWRRVDCIQVGLHHAAAENVDLDSGNVRSHQPISNLVVLSKLSSLGSLSTTLSLQSCCLGSPRQRQRFWGY